MSDPLTPGTAPAPVRAEVAEAGPKGFGGWLIFPVLGLMLTPPLVLLRFFTDFTELFEPGVWDALTTPGSGAYHILILPVIIFEIAGNLILFVLPFIAVWKLKFYSRGFPKLTIGFLVFNVVFQAVDTVLAAQYADAIGQAPDTGSYDDFKDLGRAIVGALIWIPYFLVSKRVKNTFIN